MANQLLLDKSEKFTVSTVRTLAGDGGDSKPLGSPFAESDYDTPWPFETLIFPSAGGGGVYHEAYASEKEAREGHARVFGMVKRNEGEYAWKGKGVDGTVFGNPSLTGDQWRALQHVKKCKVPTKNKSRTRSSRKRPLRNSSLASRK
jgi:hypothetical protein